MTDETAISIPLAAVVATGGLTIVLAAALAYALRERRAAETKQEAAAVVRDAAEASRRQRAGDEPPPQIDEEQYPGGALTVYYATQTGTAEAFSRQIEREGGARGFAVRVVDLEDVTALAQLTDRCLFVVATYGEGEAPDNAAVFVRHLREASGVELIPLGTAASHDDDAAAAVGGGAAQPPKVLEGVEFAVFGLGNKQYDHYNAMGKFVDGALPALGARRLVALGLGNDDDDVEADFDAWKDGKLWPALERHFHSRQRVVKATSHSNGAKAALALPDCPLRVIYHTDPTAAAAQPKPNYDLPLDQIHSSSRHYFTAFECPVVAVRELQSVTGTDSTPSTASSTVHVEIDIAAAVSLRDPGSGSASPLTYTTADNLGVLPVNDRGVVDAVARALGYDLDALISVVPAAAVAAPGNGAVEWHGAPFPTPCTVRECLTRYVDVTSAPRRSDLKLLAAYCRDATDQKALLRMAGKEGRHEYKAKILDGYTGLVDILKLCPSLQMPLAHCLNVCSVLQTRFFTISSSSSVHPDRVHLTVAVTKHQRIDGSLFHGVCSTHLAQSLSNNGPHKVRVFHRPSSFRLPVDASRPILMVGPGTGIAPMRAFLQERSYQRDVLRLPVGANILYFGCKRSTQDFIYKDELLAFQASGVLKHLRVAFSREQNEKVYVQHLLKQNGAETWTLIDDEAAHIYVCGGVRMGQDVSEALKEIISLHGGMSVDAAKDYLAKLSHDGRFIQELWA